MSDLLPVRGLEPTHMTQRERRLSHSHYRLPTALEVHLGLLYCGHLIYRDLAFVATKCHADILKEAFWNVDQRAKISFTKSEILIKMYVKCSLVMLWLCICMVDLIVM